jgi:hypothetical protein
MKTLRQRRRRPHSSHIELLGAISNEKYTIHSYRLRFRKEVPLAVILPILAYSFFLHSRSQRKSREHALHFRSTAPGRLLTAWQPTLSPPSTITRPPVPGLAHSANPHFKNVDEFQSRQLLSNLVDQGKYPQADYDKLGSSKGISHQERNYFSVEPVSVLRRQPCPTCADVGRLRDEVAHAAN